MIRPPTIRSRARGWRAAVLVALLVGCGAPTPIPQTNPPIIDTGPSTSPTAVKSANLGGFPFPVGTTWVYSRDEYAQAIGDRNKIMTATQIYTDTVAQIDETGPALSFAVERTVGEASAPDGWWGGSVLNPGQYWYRIDGNRILSMRYPTSQENGLLYDFPLRVGKSWCPGAPPPQNPNCEGHARVVWDVKPITTPFAKFDECFDVVEEYTSGGIHEWFCPGVGVVTRKYDHSGTRFGYEDKLIRMKTASAP